MELIKRRHKEIPMSNPRPLSYAQVKHKPECSCPICGKTERSANRKIQKAFRLQKITLELLASASEKTGKHQNQLIEEAVTEYLKEGEN
ncbi:MAG: hypothetical protein AB9903_12490 [Vulcanimicrobiota bacterium]